MTEAQFAAATLAWHDFYLATAGASAALLGLLFVGVSINLGTIAGAERIDLRARSALAFSNLVYVLIISLLMLIALPESHGLAIGLGAISLIGLFRAIRHLVSVMRARAAMPDLRATLRRIGWTILADVLLAGVAVGLYLTGDGHLLSILMAAIVILLIGAADVAWELLVLVSDSR
jgi:hypothetical protein